MVKSVKVDEAVQLVDLYEKERQGHLDNVSVRIQLALKRNMRTIRNMANDFFELRDELEKPLNEKYFTDERSVEVVDENGETTGRSVKPEFMDDFKKEWTVLNEKLKAALANSDDLELTAIDVDAEATRLDEKGLTLSNGALELLCFFEGGTDE